MSHPPDSRKLRIRLEHMPDHISAIDDPSNIDYNDNGQPIQIDYEITIVGRERGHRLAIEQANSILEVLEWFGRQTPPPIP